jgi:hydroxymethylpyrimidine/phosphomethylpyrimidine kinase
MSERGTGSETAGRTPAPVSPPVVLTVAGSDSGGGAGVQADLKTAEAHGTFGTSVVTAVTAQNSRGVDATHVLSADDVAAQYDAVTADFDVRAAKTGMLATAEVVRLVADRAVDLDAPLVVDPVMVAESGDRLLEPDAEAAYEDLAAAAAVVTPNAPEAEVLTGVEVTDAASAVAAGERLVDLGADAALVTGGHLGGDTAVDALVTPGGAERFERPRVATDATHGSGCTLSAAIAARLARGDDLRDAVAGAAAFVARAVRYPLDVGEGPGAVHHQVELRERAARDDTAEAVASVVRRLVESGARPLVPEVGTNVVGATPYAEATSEVAAVEGRLTRTLSGVEPTGGVRFGASSHAARFLLAAREFDPDLRFAANVRFGDDVERALDALDGPAVEFDRAAQPDEAAAAEGSTMAWGAQRAFETADGTPVAVYDRGAHGKEPMVRLLARDADALANRMLTLLDEVEE